MLPATLVGAYQLYKQDTDSIAAWLASTALVSGYPRDKLQGTGKGDTPEKTGRLKGKARKDAKQDAKSKPQATYRIEIKDFIILSEYLAGKQVQVPPAFASTLDRLISVRRSFGTRLEKHGGITDECSEQKHSFFVTVLEKVRDTLCPMYRIPMEAAVAPKPTTPLDQATNRFAALTVHEPSDAPLNTTNVEPLERPKQPKGDDNAYEAEPLTTLGDTVYAVWLMIEDLNKIRDRVHRIWSDYKDGLYNLTTAAVATNTAVDLARSISEEVIPQTKAFGGMHTILLLAFQFVARMKGYDLRSPTVHDFLQSDKCNDELYLMGRDAFYWTSVQLQIVAKDFKHDRGKFYKPEEDVLDHYDPRSDRATLTAEEKLKVDRTLIVALFNELFTANLIKGYPIQDELMRGAKELSDTGEIPFYLVFATEVFLDIHHFLRHEATLAFHTLETNLDHMRKDVEEYLQIHNEVKIKNDNTITAGNTYLKFAEYIFKDPIYNRKEALYEASENLQMPATMERNRILRLSPVLSGLVLFTFRTMYRVVGLKLNAMGLITSALHLQNGLQNEQLLTGDWDDVKLLGDILPDKSFFAGAAPTGPRQYMNHFEIQMGFSVVNNARNRRKDIAIKSKKGFRGNIHEHRIPLLSMFFDRYVDAQNRVDRTAKNLNEFIAFVGKKLSTVDGAGVTPPEQTTSPAKHRKSKGNKAIGKMKSRSTRATEELHIPPEQLIERLAVALDKEWVELAYPWIRMHCISWEYLQDVDAKCKTDLRLFYGADLAEAMSTTKDWQVVYLTAHIFFAASRGYMPLVHRAAEATNGFQTRSGRRVFEQQSACTSSSDVARLTGILEASSPNQSQ